MRRKSVQNIKTMSGRSTKDSGAYTSYLKVSCLEMERLRLSRERAGALRRVATIEARLAQIDAEKDALLRALGERRDEPRRAAEREAATGFRLTY